jgi:hypothetical protein
MAAMLPHLISQTRSGIHTRAICSPVTLPPSDAKSAGLVTRWNKIRQSKEVQLYARLHSDICNVPLYLIAVVSLLIKLNKAPSSFNLMNKPADSKVDYKFLDAKLFVIRIRVKPDFYKLKILLSKREALRYIN